jgi:cytochrome c-type biogenesis protein CcmH/NrfG
MDRTKINKTLIIASGVAVLGSSLVGLGGMIATSLNQPAVQENAQQSQDSQLKTQEKGFMSVLQREPKNHTALRGLVQIRLQLGDIAGTRSALGELIKLDPANKEYKELLAAIDKQIADSKKAASTAKPAAPKPSSAASPK